MLRNRSLLNSLQRVQRRDQGYKKVAEISADQWSHTRLIQLFRNSSRLDNYLYSTPLILPPVLDGFRVRRWG
jgi:hypothetical protein